MPNWCMNTATIYGDQEDLIKIQEAAENNKLLEFLAPIGEWDYGTAVETWGIKWEVHEVNTDLDDGVLTLNFDSAWGPPTNAYAAGEGNHGVSITASYYEPGMMFIGQYDSGSEESWDIDFEDENWRDTIPQDLIDDWGLEDEYENWKEFQEEE